MPQFLLFGFFLPLLVLCKVWKSKKCLLSFLTGTQTIIHPPLNRHSKMSIPCEARCGRQFASISSMHSHLSKARSCAWYEIGKLRALGIDNNGDSYVPIPSQPHDPENNSDWEEEDPQQDPVVDMEFGPYEDEFQFLPIEEPAAGTGQQNAKYPVLEDVDDQRFVQIDEEAGRIYRHDAPPRHCQVDMDGDSLMDNGEPNPFFPFASELDWRVAQWAVKDGPGHNAFNRLLEIPGVNKSN
jgi:hypothetical protein